MNVDAEHAALLERNRARVSYSAPVMSPEKREAAREPAEVEAPVPKTADQLLDLAAARAALEQAITDRNWAKAGELEHRIIPELERNAASSGTAHLKEELKPRAQPETDTETEGTDWR